MKPLKELKALTKRQAKLVQLVDIFQPRTIVEIGTYNEYNAALLLTVAHKYHERPEYIGYDLFETASAQTDAEEFNVKEHPNAAEVEANIRKYCPFADVNLIKGNTRQTLQSVTADFAFIDGGHSVETIRHDYEAVKHSGVVVFDDFYRPMNNGSMPDVSKYGCNLIVSGIPHYVIEVDDAVRLERGGDQCGWNGLAVTFGKA